MEERVKYLEQENKSLHQAIQEESYKAEAASRKAFIAWYKELYSGGCRNAR